MNKALSRLPTALAGAVAGILVAVFATEGGYVNNPNDPGGATNHGVTERVARQAGYTGDMRAFPKHCEDGASVCADAIYVRDYIERPGFLPVIGMSPAVGEELVDSAVNFGPHRPSCWFQRSLNYLDNAGLVEDCKIGPASVRAYSRFVNRRGKVAACVNTLKMLDAQQAAEYMRLVNANGKLRTFAYGWSAHRVENVARAKCGG